MAAIIASACLLQPRSSRSVLAIVNRDEWTNGQLSEHDRGDQRLDREGILVEALGQDDRRRVENASGGSERAHSRPSRT